MNWCRKEYCCPWYGQRRFRKTVSLHLLILLISSFVPVLCLRRFSRIYSALIHFFNVTEFSFLSIIISSIDWLFCILCNNFTFRIDHKFVFLLSLSLSVLLVCWNLHARQIFPSPFAWRAESDVVHPFGRLHRKRETECRARVSTTCPPIGEGRNCVLQSLPCSQTRTQFPQFRD